MNKTIRKILFLLGLSAFVFPFVSGFYKMSTESWQLFDWLIMYSFIWWPTYIVGAVLILVAVKRKKRK